MCLKYNFLKENVGIYFRCVSIKVHMKVCQEGNICEFIFEDTF